MATPAAATYVLFIARDDDLCAWPLPPFGLLTLGRSRSCDVRLADKLVSAHHAVLAIGSSGFSLTDLDSRNGTRVGDEVIPAFQPIQIRPGEAVWIGQTLLTIDIGADHQTRVRGSGSTSTHPDTAVSAAPPRETRLHA